MPHPATAALIATIIAGSQPAPIGPDTVATGRDAADRMTVPVKIGDHGPYRFLIDTGAQATVVAADLAAPLGLAPATRRTVLGVAGARQVDTAEVDDIDLGPRSYNGLIAPLLARSDLAADGIVGLDGLQGERLLLDFAGNRMALVAPHAQGEDHGFEIVVTARRRLGQLIMTHALVDGVDTDVIIDTGSDVSIGNPALERARSSRRSEPTTLHSVTGQEIPADIGDIGELHIDRMRIRNIRVAFAPSPVFTALKLDRRPAMLLGMHELQQFRRVAIDFASRRVLFDLPGA